MTFFKNIIALQNEERATGLQRFFKTGKGEYGEGDQFLGISVPDLRKIAKTHLSLSDSEIITMLQNPFHEVRLVALYLWVYQFEKASSLRKREIYTLYLQNLSGINNWDLVDTSAPHIIGVFLQENPAESRKFLYDFADSENLWQRRIAILSTFAFLRKGEFDDTLRLAEILLSDTHDLIQKAVGWMLREMGKRDEKKLLDFLDMHAMVMPRTMLRYAIEKFSETKRKYYLSLKV